MKIVVCSLLCVSLSGCVFERLMPKKLEYRYVSDEIVFLTLVDVRTPKLKSIYTYEDENRVRYFSNNRPLCEQRIGVKYKAQVVTYEFIDYGRQRYFVKPYILC